MEITLRHNVFRLHTSGAVFWQEQNTLLVSDVHLGKISHFRKHGIAIPEGAVGQNFKRLTEVIRLFNPYRIIFLGDLFHSELNNEWLLFAEWANTITAKILLVEGNHDVVERQRYAELNIAVEQRMFIDEFLLTHYPVETEGLFNICGHVHPGIKLRDLGRQSIKLPCFFKKERQLILPAFGAFTGKYFIEPNENDEVYAVAKNEVIRVF